MTIIEFPAKKDWEIELLRDEVHVWRDDGLDPEDYRGRFAFFGALVGVFCVILSAVGVVVLMALAL
jgi:hypothetical protein